MRRLLIALASLLLGWLSVAQALAAPAAAPPSTTPTARDVVSTAKSVEPGEEPKGDKIAAIAIGFAPTFFDRLSGAGHTLERPAVFTHQPAAGWLPGLPPTNADVLFYVASVAETRVNEFLAVVNTSGVVEAVTMERGYQRSDDTEPFGYKDSVRNVAKSRRPEVVFVHTAGNEPDEPRWTDGGTYMVTMKIEQHVSAFQALPDDTARDNVIGRRKDGIRLDLVGTASDPRGESTEVPTGLPPASHVRKAGPRGLHDDTRSSAGAFPTWRSSAVWSMLACSSAPSRPTQRSSTPCSATG